MTVTQTDEPFELVTPTGAALLRVWTRTLDPVPTTATVVRSAFGFGSHTLNSRPNVLRATLLAETAADAPAARDLLVLESNLDDCNPEWLGALTADLLERGALDVWHTPAVMKKGRPGTVLSVLTDATRADALCEWVFRATTTFGVRRRTVQRDELERRIEQVTTRGGWCPSRSVRFRAARSPSRRNTRPAPRSRANTRSPCGRFTTRLKPPAPLTRTPILTKRTQRHEHAPPPSPHAQHTPTGAPAFA